MGGGEVTFGFVIYAVKENSFSVQIVYLWQYDIILGKIAMAKTFNVIVEVFH